MSDEKDKEFDRHKYSIKNADTYQELQTSTSLNDNCDSSNHNGSVLSPTNLSVPPINNDTSPPTIRLGQYDTRGSDTPMHPPPTISNEGVSVDLNRGMPSPATQLESASSQNVRQDYDVASELRQSYGDQLMEYADMTNMSTSANDQSSSSFPLTLADALNYPHSTSDVYGSTNGSTDFMNIPFRLADPSGGQFRPDPRFPGTAGTQSLRHRLAAACQEEMFSGRHGHVAQFGQPEHVHENQQQASIYGPGTGFGSSGHPEASSSTSDFQLVTYGQGATSSLDGLSWSSIFDEHTIGQHVSDSNFHPFFPEPAEPDANSPFVTFPDDGVAARNSPVNNSSPSFESFERSSNRLAFGQSLASVEEPQELGQESSSTALVLYAATTRDTPTPSLAAIGNDTSHGETVSTNDHSETSQQIEVNESNYDTFVASQARQASNLFQCLGRYAGLQGSTSTNAVVSSSQGSLSQENVLPAIGSAPYDAPPPVRISRRRIFSEAHSDEHDQENSEPVAPQAKKSKKD